MRPKEAVEKSLALNQLSQLPWEQQSFAEQVYLEPRPCTARTGLLDSLTSTLQTSQGNKCALPLPPQCFFHTRYSAEQLRAPQQGPVSGASGHVPAEPEMILL